MKVGRDSKEENEQIALIAKDAEIQPRDRLKALEMLAKYHGLLDRKQDDGNEGVKVVIDDEEEWAG